MAGAYGAFHGRGASLSVKAGTPLLGHSEPPTQNVESSVHPPPQSPGKLATGRSHGMSPRGGLGKLGMLGSWDGRGHGAVQGRISAAGSYLFIYHNKHPLLFFLHTYASCIADVGLRGPKDSWKTSPKVSKKLFWLASGPSHL